MWHLRRDDEVECGRGVDGQRERQVGHHGPDDLPFARVARLAPRAHGMPALPEAPRRPVRVPSFAVRRLSVCIIMDICRLDVDE